MGAVGGSMVPSGLIVMLLSAPAGLVFKTKNNAPVMSIIKTDAKTAFVPSLSPFSLCTLIVGA